MAKLRHIAITVQDLEESASFYERVFGLERQMEDGVAIALSDGVVNLTLLKFPTDEMAGDERGKNFVGLHHMGFVVEDLNAAGALIEANGGTFHKGPMPQMAAETKYRDPNGVIFDISQPQHAWPGIS